MNDEIKTSCEISPEKYGPKATLAQWLAVIIQSFLFIGSGMNIAIPAIVIRDLYKKSNDEFSITVTEASWYGSLLFMIHPIGCFISGITQEKFGKKCCMILANVPSIIGWILLYSAYSSILLYASILLMGFSTGFGAGSTSSYVGEISEPRLRGSLGSLGSTSMRIGTLLVYIMGTFFDWRTVALLSTLCPFVSICLVTIIPESPMWLVSKGKNEKAETAMCWLRGWVEPDTIKHEFVELIRYNDVSGNRGDSAAAAAAADDGLFSKLAQFKDPSVYRPFRLVMISFFIAFISGLFLTRPFTFKIMTEIDLVNNQNEIMAILSSLSFLGSIIATATVHRVGIRFLTLSTLSIITILLFLFGTYIISFKNNYIQSFPGISFTILCSIYFFGSCGIVCMPWMIHIEVFPNKIRGIATSACSGLAYILLFALTKSYLPIQMFLSIEYTMILFGCIGLFGLIYLYFYLPETKKKTFLEIEEFFTLKSNG